MYKKDGEKLQCALGTMDFGFLAGQENREACVFIYIYLSNITGLSI